MIKVKKVGNWYDYGGDVWFRSDMAFAGRMPSTVKPFFLITAPYSFDTERYFKTIEEAIKRADELWPIKVRK